LRVEESGGEVHALLEAWRDEVYLYALNAFRDGEGEHLVCAKFFGSDGAVEFDVFGWLLSVHAESRQDDEQSCDERKERVQAETFGGHSVLTSMRVEVR
jgi:extradiol dioxygenase family protein